ncbi:MAG: hypothetical protein ACKVQR_04565 [Aquabacterium sp.]
MIERLGQASNRAAQRPKFREFLSKLGALSPGTSPQDFGHYMRDERAQYQALIAENNIRME